MIVTTRCFLKSEGKQDYLYFGRTECYLINDKIVVCQQWWIRMLKKTVRVNTYFKNEDYWLKTRHYSPV